MNGDALTLLFVGAGIYFARNSRTTSTSKKRGPLYLIVLGACIAGCNSQNKQGRPHFNERRERLRWEIIQKQVFYHCPFLQAP